jgi:hypothetical protein
MRPKSSTTDFASPGFDPADGVRVVEGSQQSKGGKEARMI